MLHNIIDALTAWCWALQRLTPADTASSKTSLCEPKKGHHAVAAGPAAAATAPSVAGMCKLAEGLHAFTLTMSLADSLELLATSSTGLRPSDSSAASGGLRVDPLVGCRCCWA
jgi:hypothetical protein